MEFVSSASVADANQAVGFDVEGARAVAKAFGLQLQIKNTGFDALIPDLTAGRCDIVWTALFVSQKRLPGAPARPPMAPRPRGVGPQGQPKKNKNPPDPLRQKGSSPTGGGGLKRDQAPKKARTPPPT